MLKAVGALLLALGLLVGGALVLAPLGLANVRIGAAPSVLFTSFVGAGYLLLAVASRLEGIRVLTRLVGGALLLLAAGAAIGLARLVMAFEVPAGPTLQVAFVLLVSGTFGSAALLSLRPVAAT